MCFWFFSINLFLRLLVFDNKNLFIGVLQRKRIPLKVEKGTGGMSDVDISWIPQETLNAMSMFSSSSLCSHSGGNEAMQEADIDYPIFQTRLHLEHLQGNEPTERPERISDSFHHCTLKGINLSRIHFSN